MNSGFTPPAEIVGGAVRTLLAAATLCAGTLAAQDPTAVRTQIVAALASGDSVTAARASAQLSALQAAAPNVRLLPIR